jgi:hypothetical protein
MKPAFDARKAEPPPGPLPAAPAADPGHGHQEESRAGFFLVAFMRLLAAVWLMQGLLQWSAILLPPEPLFYKVSAFHGSAVVFFAVFDLVAAAGLWLATPWGGALWLFSAIAQIFVTLVLPGFFSMLWAGADIAFISIYFALTWKASHAAAPRSKPQ